jgi:hypothetical protein
MAGKGGYRPGSGRPKGALNKTSVASLKQYEKLGAGAPVDVHLNAMRYYYERAQVFVDEQTNSPPEEDADLDKLEQAIDHAYDKASDHAGRAAPYIHPRMPAMDYGSRFDATRLTNDERRTLTRLLAKGLGVQVSDDPPLEIEHEPVEGGHERADESVNSGG